MEQGFTAGPGGHVSVTWPRSRAQIRLALAPAAVPS